MAYSSSVSSAATAPAAASLATTQAAGTSPAAALAASPSVLATPGPSDAFSLGSGAGTANAAAAPTDLTSLINSIVQVGSQLIQMLQGLLGGGSAAGITTANGSLAAPAPTAAIGGALGSAPAGTKGNAGGLTRNVVIAQIDNFSTDQSGFNHGEEMAKTMRSGGGDPSLAGKVDLLQFQINNGSVRDIADYLEQITAAVQSGQTIDAVEIPQFVSTPDADTARANAAIEQLSALGVPVVVAAGNSGPQQNNALGNSGAFLVQNLERGQIDPESGTGNILFQGPTTSYASANLATVVAAKKALGLSMDQIVQQLSV
ncbi:MAG: hypothetical protein VKJ04_00455 [Vampirovibrionales bacterium]|nr:hypothetical protein [Vampirovibrionales bacterium]